MRTVLTIIATLLFAIPFTSAQQHTLTINDVDLDAETNTLSLLSSDFYNHSYSKIIIPDTIDGIAIKNIGHDAGTFLRFNGLDSLEISEGIETIGDYAFYRCYLNHVELPSSITSIGDFAFMNNNLSTVKIPASMMHIGESAFSYNSIDTIDFTYVSQLDTISKKAFSNNELSGTLTIPDYVKVIDIDAFAHNEIDSLVYPETVELLGGFQDNNISGTINIPSHVKTIGPSAFRGNNISELTFDEGITKIDAYAFAGNNSLTDIIFPNSLKSIGAQAFFGLDLVSITFGDSISKLYSYCFGLNRIKNITVPGQLTLLDEGVFYRNMAGTDYQNNIIVEEGITEIPEKCFAEMQILGSLSLPSTLTEIKPNAFFNTFAQSEYLVLPKSVSTTEGLEFSHWVSYEDSVDNVIEEVTSIVGGKSYGYKAIFAPTAIDNISLTDNSLIIKGNTIRSDSETFEVYNISGYRIFVGTQTQLPRGIYIVKPYSAAGCIVRIP